MPLYSAVVARPVGKAELQSTPKAQEAMKHEWDRLNDQKKRQVWDLSTVREAHEVMAEAKKAGKKIHIGRVFGICVQKGSELPEHLRSYKGRFVFQGNDVRDENKESEHIRTYKGRFVFQGYETRTRSLPFLAR